MHTRPHAPVQRALGILLATFLSVVLAATSAQAATSWSRSTTGASGSGTYSRSNQTYTVSYKVTDTLADGDCAYLRLRPKVRIAYTGTWLSVGLSGYEYRREVCGKGNSISGTKSIDVYAQMSALDRTAGDMIKMEISVCRNRSWATDNCSSFTTPAVSF